MATVQLTDGSSFNAVHPVEALVMTEELAVLRETLAKVTGAPNRVLDAFNKAVTAREHAKNLGHTLGRDLR